MESRRSANKDDKAKPLSTFFDLTSSWKFPDTKGEGLSSTDFWNKILSSDKDKSDERDTTDTNTNSVVPNDKSSDGSGFQKLSKGLLSFMAGVGGNDPKQQTMSEIVAQARKTVEQGEIQDNTSLDEIFKIFDQYKDLIVKLVEKYVSGIDLAKFTPTGLFYYLENEDERKNPSWKNRVNRFCRGIDINQIERLNEALEISLLTYVDSVDKIKEGLARGKQAVKLELVYADVKSNPGEPAHFIAVPIDQPASRWAPLEVVIGVRGTKSLADAVTDALCDSEQYKDGKAHQYILRGGRYLFHKHKTFLEDLCQRAGKSKIKLTLIGHSLGAGAASIAGIEFSEIQSIDVEVVGFGCPALLSKDLAKKYTFITTVVNDSDCIPRTSAATVTNLLLSLVEFNWIPYAKKDVQHALCELQRVNPAIFTDEFVGQIQNTIEPLMDEHLDPLIEKDVKNRAQPELFPPGQIIHLYRDGRGISACYVPNTFFGELDVSRRMIDGMF